MHRLRFLDLPVVGIATLSVAALGCGARARIDTARIPHAPELGLVEVQRAVRLDRPGWRCAGDDDWENPGFFGAPVGVDAALWSLVLHSFVLKRTADRVWLRETLERINAAADEAGMSQEERAAALHRWVVCHVSTEARERMQLAIINSQGGMHGRGR